MQANPPKPLNLTSSQTGTFYFAYGSNLSPEQMAGRCLHSPADSSTPVAIARLDGWKWLICQRGYANIVPSPSSPNARISQQQQQQQGQPQHHSSPKPPPATAEEGASSSSSKDVVWGIIYNLSPADEAILDEYEGHDRFRNPTPTAHKPTPYSADEVRRKPFLQGNWDYNKLYLRVRVTKWLKAPGGYGVHPDPNKPAVSDSAGESAASSAGPPRWGGSEDEVTALVYVDELRTEEAIVQTSYVGRMNRAIAQGVQLGLPQEWVERVMRKWIVKGVGTQKGYLGRRDGYWDQES